MFSRRTSWDLQPNALSRRLAERSAPPRFDLTEGNPTRCGLAWDPDVLRRALDVGGAERYEPDPQGMRSARDAVAAYYAARGIAADPDSLFLTASTSEAYSWLFKLLADPGDAVLVPRPGYPLFEYLAGLESVEVDHYPMRFDGEWWLDIAAIRARVADRTKPRVRAVVVVNPGNPTGAYLSLEEARALAEVCAAHDVAVVSDEVFSDFPHAVADAARAASLAGTRDALTFVLGGLSKALALPQMKLGWILAGGPAPLVAEAKRRLEIVADTWLPVGVTVQLAAPRLLAEAPRVHERVLARVRGNLAVLRAAIPPEAALSVLPVEGGWYAVLRVPAVKTDDAWALSLLDEADVLVQPGYYFDFDRAGHLVVSLLPEAVTFAEGTARLVSAIVRGAAAR